uniref:Uncharacterized protein n=1 Tax=Caenorhabditis japonica TaxID=281687 RepID=A0A8R1EAC1_CAEJA
MTTSICIHTWHVSFFPTTSDYDLDPENQWLGRATDRMSLRLTVTYWKSKTICYNPSMPISYKSHITTT